MLGGEKLRPRARARAAAPRASLFPIPSLRKAGAGSMIELMKFDCGGSAATLGAAKAIGLLKRAPLDPATRAPRVPPAA